MAISEKIKYDFKHLESGIIAFVANIESKLKTIMPNIPVYIIETGDLCYYVKEKFIETDYKEIYNKIPRFVIQIQTITSQKENNTNPYNIIDFNFDNENYEATVRRTNVLISLDTSLITSNFVMGLSAFEIMDSIMCRENVFTYEYLGNTYEGAFNLSSESMEKPTMEASSATRDLIIKNSIDLNLQVFTPRVETIKNLKDAGYDTVEFDLTVKEVDEKDDYTTKLIINKDDE